MSIKLKNLNTLARTNLAAPTSTRPMQAVEMAAASVETGNLKNLVVAARETVFKDTVLARGGRRVETAANMVIREQLLNAGLFTELDDPLLDVIPSMYDESRGEFLASLAALRSPSDINLSDVETTGIIGGTGEVELTIAAATEQIGVPGVAVEIGVGPQTQGIGRANVVISGFPAREANPTPSTTASVLARFRAKPRAGVIGTAIVLFGSPNVWGRRQRYSAKLGGALPFVYTPGDPPTLPATGQGIACDITVNVSGLPEGTVITARPLIPGSAYYDRDVAAFLAEFT